MLLSTRNFSVSIRRLKYDFDYTFSNSFQTWKQEILNYDELDGHLQDNIIKYSIPYYHRNLLVEHDKTQSVSYCLKTHLKGPTPASIIDPDEHSNSQWFINEIRTERYPALATAESRHIVMLHGFAASAVWWGRNISEIMDKCTLPERSNTSIHIHALDLLGFGLSGRPDVAYSNESRTYKQLDITTSHVNWGKDPTCKSCGGRVDGRKDEQSWCKCGEPRISINTRDILNYLPNQRALVSEVEELYIESLEQWRIANNIENFDLVAHSFGGYMSVAYALKYPQRVNKLVLVSPGGMERSPFAVTNPMYLDLLDKAKSGSIPNKLVSHISNNVDSYQFLGRYFKTSNNFRKLWNANISFFWLIRWLGPLGPKVIYGQFGPKLSRTGAIKGEKELEDFIKYMYSTYIRSSFSETSINRIFEATVVGKVPILDKLQLLNETQFKDSFWMFGKYDFMYNKTGEVARDILLKQGKRSKFEIIDDAGHNVNMDNYKTFNERVINFLELN